MRSKLYALLMAIFMIAFLWGCSGGGGGSSPSATPGTTSITVNGQIQASASSASLSAAAFTLPPNNTVKIYNTQNGSEIATATIDSSGKFSVKVDLPSDKKIAITIAANYNNQGYRAILPIDLSSLPSSFVGSSNATVVLNSTTTQLAQQILGDGFKLDNKTVDEIKSVWVDAGGTFIGYFSGNVEVRGKIDTSLPGAATLLTSTDMTKEACATCHQKTTWGDLSVAKSHELPNPIEVKITSVTKNTDNFSINFTVKRNNSPLKLDNVTTSTFSIYIARFDSGTKQWVRVLSVSPTRNATDVVPSANMQGSNGTYTYYWKDNNSNVALNSSEVYRFGVTVRSGYIGTDGNYYSSSTTPNATTLRVSGSDTYDMVPSGAQFPSYQRKLVTTNNCLKCHDTPNFGVHGGSRNTVELCVTCHQPSYNNVTVNTNFTVIIHGWHKGNYNGAIDNTTTWHNLTGVTNHTSTVGYPASLSDCDRCHGGAANSQEIYKFGGTTTDASAACGSCHSNIFYNKTTFELGSNNKPTNRVLTVIHVNSDNRSQSANIWKWAFSESTCGICHNGSMAPDIKEAHKDREGENGKGISYVIDNVTYDNATKKLTVTWYAKYDNGTKLNLLNTDNNSGPIFINVNRGGLSYAVSLLFAFKTADDFNNQGLGTNSAQPASLAISATNTKNLGGNVFSTEYTVPANVVAKQGVVAVQGIPVVKVGNKMEYARVNSVTKSFALQGSPVNRRAVVDIEKCRNCHGNIVFHGHNRINNIELCTTCHNPSATEKDKRNLWFALGVGKLDGKNEESYNFQYMIHSIHAVGDAVVNPNATPYILYRNTGTTGGSGIYMFRAPTSPKPIGWWDNDSRFYNTPIEYPSSAKNCMKCHISMPGFVDSTKALAFTVEQGSSLTTDSDDTVIGPNAAVCKSCHKSQNATNHILKNTFFGILTSLVDKLKIALGQ